MGHSMMPVLPPGTTVWATPLFRRLKIGNVVICIHDGKEKIKRISDIREDEVHLTGDHLDNGAHAHTLGWVKRDQITAKLVWPRAPKDRAEQS